MRTRALRESSESDDVWKSGIPSGASAKRWSGVGAGTVYKTLRSYKTRTSYHVVDFCSII